MHIGHARTYCFWDFFRRYLEYLNYHVLSVINYTDIDDRIMDRAGRAGAIAGQTSDEHSDPSIGPAPSPGRVTGVGAGPTAGAGSVDVAEANIARFRLDCRRLKIKDYAAYTRAT